MYIDVILSGTTTSTRYTPIGYGGTPQSAFYYNFKIYNNPVSLKTDLFIATPTGIMYIPDVLNTSTIVTDITGDVTPITALNVYTDITDNKLKLVYTKTNGEFVLVNLTDNNYPNSNITTTLTGKTTKTIILINKVS